MAGRGQSVTGLTDKQLQVFEDLASDYMVELLTQIANKHAAAMLDRAGLTAAADPLIPENEPPPTPPPTPADFAAIPSEVNAAIAQNIIPLVAQAYISGGGVIRSNLIDAGVTGLPRVHSVDAEAYLRTAPIGYYDWIGADLLDQVRTGLADGLAAGDSIPELADRVKAAAGITSRQATLTARTSVIAANNSASIDVMAAAQIDGTEKEWLATNDLRTRASHLAADGQRVPLDGKFLLDDGSECEYPGEYTLPPAQRDNCRCTVGYVIPDRVIGPTGGAEAYYSGDSLAQSYVQGDITHSQLIDAVENPPALPGHLGGEGLPTPIAAPTDAASRIGDVMAEFNPESLRNRQAMIDYFDAHVSKLSKAQRDALERYSEQNFADFNTSLRAGDVERNATQLRDLDAAMRPLPDDLLLYRTLDGPEALGLTSVDDLGTLVGRTISDRAPLSTSLDRRYRSNAPIRMTIAAPEGTPAALMRALSSNPDEMEVLLGRDLDLVITKVAKREPVGYDISAVITPKVERAAKAVETHPAVPAPARAGKAAGAAAAPDVIPIRPGLQAATSTAAVEGVFEAQAQRITGRVVTADFRGSSLVTAREHAEGVLRVLERYPDAQLDGIVTHQLVDPFYAQAGGGVIEFNTTYASAAGRANYLFDLSRGTREIGTGLGRWSVIGSGNPAATAIHEMGHILGLDTLGATVNAEVERVVRDMAVREGLAVKQLVNREISIYASTDTDELLAEAMTDVVLNGSGASELSREIMAVVDQAYKDEGHALVETLGRVKPKQAFDPLAGKTVPQLRTLARERGVTIPTGAKKDDIVALLREQETTRAEIAASEALTPAQFEARIADAKTGDKALQTPTVRLVEDKADRKGERLVGLGGSDAAITEARDALLQYRINLFSPINDYLRGIGKDVSFKPTIEAIDSVMKDARLSGDIQAWRGVKDSAELFGSDQVGWDGLVGKTWTDPAYTSTTTSRAIGERYAGKDGGALLRILVPDGTPGVAMSGADFESEVMLDRRLTFRVVADNGVDSQGRHLLDVEVVPREVPAVPLVTATPAAAVDDLARQTLPQLRSLARDQNVAGYSLMTKPQLVERLTALGVQPAAAQTEVAALADLTPAVRRRLTGLLEQVGANDGGSFGFGNLEDLQRLESRGLVREEAGSLTNVVNGRAQMTESKWHLTDEGRVQLLGGPTPTAAVDEMATMKVPALRSLARERGVTIPTGAKKDDIVALLREAAAKPVEAVVEENPLVTAARVRQAAIDEARAVADLTAKVFESLGAEVEPAVLRTQIEQTAARLKVPDKVRDALLKAVDTGDAKKIATAADRVAKNAGLTRVGAPETEVPFSHAEHQAVPGAQVRAGEAARIIRPGYTYQYGNEVVQISKAAVEEGLTRAETIANAKRLIERDASTAQLRTAGVKKVGTVSDRPVKYDPAKYELRGGGKVPAGAKVRVVEPGYTTVYRGQVIEVSKPVVEVIPEARSASAAPLKKIMKMDDPEAQAEFAKAIDGEYAGGIRAEVQTTQRIADYEELDDGTMVPATVVTGHLYSTGGQKIGDFVRVFYNGDHGFEAHHELLQIRESYQGSGFASDFNANLYDWYRRSGIKRVTVYADIDVGGYTWATQGFDFVSTEARRDLLTYRLEPVVDKIAGRGIYSGKISKQDYKDLTRGAAFTYDEFMAQLPLFDALNARIAAGEEVSAYELSQLGRKPGQGKDDWWIGKVLMMGSHWNGVRLV